MHNPDPLLYIQSLIDQWMAGDWEDRADGIVLAGTLIHAGYLGTMAVKGHYLHGRMRDLSSTDPD